MSDTEEGSFDKEAEKEKLREQLRREEEERRSTQHMSELLLKGATMTNKHCDVCGDPLFRYDGREFCPTCAREGDSGASADAAPAEGAASGGGAGADAGTTTAGGVENRAQVASGIDRVPSTPSDDSPDPDTVETQEPRPRPADVPEDVASARAALVRKLASLARQAEATDDVRQSRELLAAAREAAEALAAIDAVRG